jgi:hypothetical protein
MVFMLKLVGLLGSDFPKILKKYPKASPNLNWSFSFDIFNVSRISRFESLRVDTILENRYTVVCSNQIPSSLIKSINSFTALSE